MVAKAKKAVLKIWTPTHYMFPEKGGEYLEVRGYVSGKMAAVQKSPRRWYLYLVSDDMTTIPVTQRYTDQLYAGIYPTLTMALKAISNVWHLLEDMPNTAEGIQARMQELGPVAWDALVTEFYDGLNQAHHT